MALAGDAAWLDQCLAGSGLDITPGKLHFRLLTGPGGAVARFAATLGAAGVAVRVLEDGYGVGRPTVRISSPGSQDRAILTAALGVTEREPS